MFGTNLNASMLNLGNMASETPDLPTFAKSTLFQSPKHCLTSDENVLNLKAQLS
jgi:hypothetical protein